MDINEYINISKNKAEARRELAQKIGCKEVTIRSWANGNRFPNRKYWNRIESATGGKVTKTDLLNATIDKFDSQDSHYMNVDNKNIGGNTHERI